MATTTVGELVLDEAVATELRQEAKRAGKEPDPLASELLSGLLERRRAHRAAIKQGVAAYEAAEVVPGDDVDAWLASWGDEEAGDAAG